MRQGRHLLHDPGVLSEGAAIGWPISNKLRECRRAHGAENVFLFIDANLSP